MKLPDRSRLFDAVFDAGEFASVTSDIAAAVGARSFLGGFAYDDGSRGASVTCDYWSQEQVDLYYRDYFHLDPWNEVALRDWRPFRALEFSDEVRPAQVERSTLYQGFIRPMGDDTFRVLSICTETPQGRGAIGFHRGKDQPEFSDQDIARLDTLAVDYARVLALRGRIDGLERAILTRSDALDALHDAVFMLTADGRIANANRAAEQLLRSGQVLQQRQGRLVAAVSGTNRSLSQALQQIPHTGMAGLRLQGTNGCALNCSLVALPASAGHAKIMLSVTGGPPPDRALLLRQIYGLSPTEAEVAVLLADGLDPADIAETRATSLHTVRAQLRSVGDKMDCRRQIDIVRRIAALPRVSRGFLS